MKINNRFSSLSQANCYEEERGENHYYMNKTNGKYGTYDGFHNDYYSRSNINDEILKKKHILFLGDSFIFGHGVPRGHTISDHFEEILNNDEYCVINLGMPGSGVHYSTLRLQQWCNSFGNQIDSIYFGISALTRRQFWFQCPSDGNEFLYNVYSDLGYDSDKRNGKYQYRGYPFISHDRHIASLIGGQPDSGRLRAEERFILKSVQKGYEPIVTSKVDSVAMFDASLQAIKTLGLLYNFNIFSFFTLSDLLTENERTMIKHNIETSNTEHQQFIFDIRHILFYWPRLDDPLRETFLIEPPIDNHWSSDGCRYVADNIHQETKHWYKNKGKNV
jgi:hypothetical protein